MSSLIAVGGVVVLVLGALWGFAIGRSGNTVVQKEKRLAEDLAQARDELNQYRQEVSSHFSKTADLVNTLTDNYRAIYQHLAVGAQELCTGDTPKLAADIAATPALTDETAAEVENKRAMEEESVEALAQANEPAVTAVSGEITMPPPVVQSAAGGEVEPTQDTPTATASVTTAESAAPAREEEAGGATTEQVVIAQNDATTAEERRIIH